MFLYTAAEVQAGGIMLYIFKLNQTSGFWYIRVLLTADTKQFNDDKVQEVKAETAVEGSYGGSVTRTITTVWEKKGEIARTETVARNHCAYMLVYVRESDMDWLMRPVEHSV